MRGSSVAVAVALLLLPASSLAAGTPGARDIWEILEPGEGLPPRDWARAAFVARVDSIWVEECPGPIPDRSPLASKIRLHVVEHIFGDVGVDITLMSYGVVTRQGDRWTIQLEGGLGWGPWEQFLVPGRFVLIITIPHSREFYQWGSQPRQCQSGYDFPGFVRHLTAEPTDRDQRPLKVAGCGVPDIDNPAIQAAIADVEDLCVRDLIPDEQSLGALIQAIEDYYAHEVQ